MNHTTKIIELEVDTSKIILFSDSQIHKTEQLIKKTKSLILIDTFLMYLSQTILTKFSLLNNTNMENKSFKVETFDKTHTFFFKFPYQITSQYILQPKDLVFYNYINKENSKIKNDFRFVEYLNEYQKFKILISEFNENEFGKDFNKIYNLSYNEQINFPLLNSEQKNIISLENQNVIIKGVAGSGKTNICIEKILFCATRNYFGKILYTTYSKSLINDTKIKVETFKNNLISLVDNYQNGKIVFADKNYSKALENKLGINLPEDKLENLIIKIKQIVDFLSNNVKYLSIKDLYETRYNLKNCISADESVFINIFLKNLRNHQLLSQLEKIKNISYEVIYKEIYGMIFGYYNNQNNNQNLSLSSYIEKRRDSFTKSECESIYNLSLAYQKFLNENDYLDNNLMCKKLLKDNLNIEKYSLTIVDEVQDFTQIELNLLKNISRKMFCVGDALQMVNPSYFNFSYLKNLLYEKDLFSVKELNYNYRSSEKIANIVNVLNSLNSEQFGTHNFIVNSKPIESNNETNAIYTQNTNFIEKLENQNINSFTIICSTLSEKEYLKEKLPNTEILTISEIKGLEREAIILYNVLSVNFDKWKYLERININRKKADENSVFRYYFNLLYVGITRAKQFLYICENKNVELFNSFFTNNFETMNYDKILKSLEINEKQLNINENEILARINDFINREQYQNAKFLCNKLKEHQEINFQLARIEVYETLVSNSLNKKAGIKFWEIGALEDAKKQFLLIGEDKLVKLINASIENNTKKLNYDIISFYDEVSDEAKELILETLINDLTFIKQTQQKISKNLKNIRKK